MDEIETKNYSPVEKMTDKIHHDDSESEKKTKHDDIDVVDDDDDVKKPTSALKSKSNLFSGRDQPVPQGFRNYKEYFLDCEFECCKSRHRETVTLKLLKLLALPCVKFKKESYNSTRVFLDVQNKVAPLFFLMFFLVNDAAADVFLWRNKKISASILGGATALWVLFELLEYHLVTLVCHILILVFAVLFLWSSVSNIMYKSPPSIPEVRIPEDPILQFTSALRIEINHSLHMLWDIGSGRDLKKFLAVAFNKKMERKGTKRDRTFAYWKQKPWLAKPVGWSYFS
ncbi:hypothetical protein E3N88_36975 [Mikania micrantha]|uniref:Reticulon-like protein n=1 Tax=Mikania micrantha TaxID=192012 RepID=A0A5N6M5A7_9ASTR|nr:hypothetical protein E3N88_36975 [Mikania micrantha]